MIGDAQDVLRVLPWGLVSALLGATMQSAVGFGMMLTAVPLMLLWGAPITYAIPLCLGAACVQTSLAVYRNRSEVDWGQTLHLAPFQWAGIALGAVAMRRFVELAPYLMRRGVGTAVLASTIILLFARAKGQRGAIHRGWGFVAAGTSGGMAGFAGMGGPPLVLFALRQDWPMLRARTFLWSQLLVGIPAVLISFTTLYGPSCLVSAGLGILLAPAVFIGQLMGESVAARTPDRISRGIGVVLLLATASSGIFAQPN